MKLHLLVVAGLLIVISGCSPTSFKSGYFQELVERANGSGRGTYSLRIHESNLARAVDNLQADNFTLISDDHEGFTSCDQASDEVYLSKPGTFPFDSHGFVVILKVDTECRVIGAEGDVTGLSSL